MTVVPRRELPIVELEFIIHGGAENDSPDRAGQTSMMAEMVDEGTPSRTALEIAEQVDYLGAHFEVAAGWHAVTASLRILAQHLDAALDIVADILMNADVPAEEFRRKQEERVNGLLQDADEAAIVATKALAAGIFGPLHPYGTPIDGTVESIKRLTRGDAIAVYRERFTAAGAHVLAVGDIDPEQMRSKLDQRFGGWTRGEEPRSAMHPVTKSAPTRILLVDKPGAAQAELRVGHAGPPRSTPDYFGLLVANTVLGGSFTSRLNTILRERMGVTYGASSRFRMRKNGGLFMAGSAILTEAAARSAEVVIEEMERMTTERVPADELLRAQSYLALGLPRSFETAEDIASHVRDQIIYGLPDDYWQTYVDRVFAVTADDVRDAAARHLHADSCMIVVVADQNDVRKALEQTRLGDVQLTSVVP